MHPTTHRKCISGSQNFMFCVRTNRVWQNLHYERRYWEGSTWALLSWSQINFWIFESCTFFFNSSLIIVSLAFMFLFMKFTVENFTIYSTAGPNSKSEKTKSKTSMWLGWKKKSSFLLNSSWMSSSMGATLELLPKMRQMQIHPDPMLSFKFHWKKGKKYFLKFPLST